MMTVVVVVGRRSYHDVIERGVSLAFSSTLQATDLREERKKTT
jgi:hypothetical protein